LARPTKKQPRGNVIVGKAGPKTTGLFADADTESDDEMSGKSTHSDDKSDDKSEQKAASTTLVSLIMDMCQPLYGSGRVVNMDNYYTSPMAAWLLAQNQVYMRGTWWIGPVMETKTAFVRW